MKPRIIIRRVQTVAEYHDCERLQQTVWQFTDREIIPINELLTIQRHGGLVLGAFTPADKMIGFAFGFPGIHKGKLIHISRMLAVLPEYRNSNIGYRLKLAQRAFALKQGIKLVTWTFDPLQSLNAHFNIEKLGVIVREYLVNLYGSSSSILNRGFETDRFQAEWWVTSRRVKERLRVKTVKHHDITTLPTALTTRIRSNGLIAPDSVRLNLTAPRIVVEIPSDIMQLKERSPALAREWRRITRQIFLHYFRKSYIVTNLVTKVTNNQRHSFYILRKSSIVMK